MIPRAAIHEQLEQAAAGSYKSCYDESCQIELGKVLSAQKSLATKLLRVGSSCASTLYDIKTEATEQAASVRTECGENALMSGIDEVVQKLQVPSDH